jgi:hypothetical protein
MRTVVFNRETTVHALHPLHGYHRARTLCGLGSRNLTTSHDGGIPDCADCLALLDYVQSLPKLSAPGAEDYLTLSSVNWARLDWEIHFRRGLTYEMLAIADAAAYQERSSLFVAERLHEAVTEFNVTQEMTLSNPDISAADLRAQIAADERTRDPSYSVGYLAEEREIAPPIPQDNWIKGGFLWVAHGPDKVVHGMKDVLVHDDRSPILDGRVASASSYCGVAFKGVLVYGERPTKVDCPTCAPAARADWEARFGAGKKPDSPAAPATSVEE